MDDSASRPTPVPPAPPDPARLARMWVAVSAAHRMLEQCQRYFDLTAADERLAEQLSLLPVLVDWIDPSGAEVDALVRTLRAYADRRAVTQADLQAAEVGAVIRLMLQERGRIGFDDVEPPPAG